DAAEREMHHKAIHTLQDAGFEHYEISNSAKPGRQCLHNLKYWSMAEYAGLGLGAHSYIEDGGTLGLRYNNTEDITAYTGSIGKGELPIEQRSLRRDTEKDAMGIYMFTGLRKREGVDLADFKARFGLPFESAFDMGGSVRKWQDAGYTEKDNGRFRLTEKGIDKSNDIMSEFV
ncbi:MAG: coproporphyrinogen III oxidase, partial [Firmicutes bacterium]|nr:coproporphyrinogen III oxidase [Bacillota bacterium]